VVLRNAAGASAIASGTDGSPVPPSIEYLWLLHRLQAGSPASNLAGAFRLVGSLDEVALRRAVTDVVARHDSLHMRLPEDDGRPRVTLVEPAVPWERVEMGAGTVGAGELRQALTRAARMTFDLAKDPLVRAHLFVLAPQEHVLLLNLHHVVADAPSLDRVWREVSLLYEANRRGDPGPALPSPGRLDAYSEWARARLESPRAQRSRKYWQRRLAELPALELPVDRPWPASESLEGARVRFRLEGALMARLRQLAAECATSLFTILLTAYAATLHRWSLQEDFGIVVSVPDRGRAAFPELVGFLLNQVVLRVGFRDEPTFARLADRVRTDLLAALHAGDLPFGQVLEAVRPRRVRGRSLLAQVSFAVRPLRAVPGLEPVEVELGVAPYELCLNFAEGPDDFFGTLDYRTSLFDAETAARFVGHYERLLKAAVDEPGRAVWELPILGDAERRVLLGTGSDGLGAVAGTEAHGLAHSQPGPPDEGLRLEQLFARQAARSPDAVAIVDDLRHWSYRAIEAAARDLADRLRARGVRPGDMVGLGLPRSADAVVAMLAVLEAGAAWVPLPQSPRDRRLRIAGEAGCRAIVSPPEAGTADGFSLDVLEPDERETAETLTMLPPPGQDTSPAYVLYTSGSTGIAKGVVGPHRAIVRRLRWMWDAYPFEESDVCSLRTPLSFVDSISETFGPLLRGVPSVVVDEQTVRDPRRLLALLRGHAITHLYVVPSLLRVLLTALDESVDGPLVSLKLVLSSGEPLTSELVAAARRLLPRSRLLNLYGATEVLDATCHDTGSRSGVTPRIPAGRALPGNQVYVLGPRREVLPVGATGEIYVAGDSLACGYHRRPDLTAAAFPTFSLEGQPPRRMYRTGDRGRVLADGSLDVIGRADSLLKVRGFRIDPVEIERALSALPGVENAAVVAWTGVEAETSLRAFVTPGGLDVGRLRRHLADSLSPHLVPDSIVALPSLPSTVSGKVDRKRLATWDAATVPPPQLAREVPQATERVLLGIWDELFGRPVGLDDDFFDLGGHSLLAFRMVSRVGAVLGKPIAPATVLAAPTVRRLARAIDEWTPVASILPFRRDGSLPPFFCVHALDGSAVYFRELAERLGPDQPFYGLQTATGEIARPLETVEGIASAHVASMLEVDPRGPHFIGGLSFGGLVAWEMARQLARRGRAPSLLVLFDTWGPGHPHYAPAWERAWAHVRNFAILKGGPARWRYLRTRLHALERVGRRRSGLLRARLFGGRLQGDRVVDPETAHMLAISRYEIPEYEGRVVLFRARDQPVGSRHAPDLGWGSRCRGLFEVVDVEGGHGALVLEPHVAAVADGLRRALAAARAARGN
jgi:amino acid adenylation domain-containing protein